MAKERHWTEESAEAFAHRLAFDFIAQIESRMDALPIKQAGLAKKLGVSEGAVSKLLNNPQNLTIRTIAKYSRALGMKASIVAYDDGDTDNQTGPINPEVFTTCWERAGKPVDLWAFEELSVRTSTAYKAYNIFVNMNFFFTAETSVVQLQYASVMNWLLPSVPYSGMQRTTGVSDQQQFGLLEAHA